MKIKRFTGSAAFIVLTTFACMGQKYLQMMNDPTVNFYDVKKEAEAYFAKHGTDEGSGYPLLASAYQWIACCKQGRQ
jgi:hypothetical protein